MRPDNFISIIGRVGAEPEMKYLSATNIVAIFNVAVNRPKDTNGNVIADWFKCEFWGKQAETVGEYVKKGSQISVVGSVIIDKYTDKNGNKRESFKIRGDGFKLLGSKNDNQTLESNKTANQSNNFTDNFEDDIPPF